MKILREPWRIEAVTAPMPLRWTNYYLSQSSYGPTTGVPWDYAVSQSDKSVVLTASRVVAADILRFTALVRIVESCVRHALVQVPVGLRNHV